MRLIKKLFILYFISFFVVSFPMQVLAQDNNVDQQIQELKQKITDTQSKEKSLNAEISSMDNQIKLVELNIRKTKNEIDALGEEIVSLSGQIEGLEDMLSTIVKLFSKRVVFSYATSRTSQLMLLLSSTNFSDLLSRAKYLQRVQLNDQQEMTRIQNTKIDLTDRKQKREEKKLTQEQLKRDLEIQNNQLAANLKAKNALLEQTKNDEATYQNLLQQALAEKEALEAALVNGEKVGPVKAGDAIALMGNTGYPACSTGTHLHFEIRKNNQWVNPGDYLKSKSTADQQDGGTSSIGSGNWDWPLEGDLILTQHYGQTPYSWRYTYSGGIHTGIDLYSNSSSIIRAPKDGTLYSSSQNCGGSSVIKIKYIEHGDGIVSFYLHVQYQILLSNYEMFFSMVY